MNLCNIQKIFDFKNIFIFSINGMIIINLLGLVSGVLFVISKPIQSYVTIIIGRFLTGFIRYICLKSELLSFFLT